MKDPNGGNVTGYLTKFSVSTQQRPPYKGIEELFAKKQ
jgi:hypothetical protein